MPIVDLPDDVMQLLSLSAAIAVETDATRKAKIVVLQRKLLRLVLPKIKEHLDQTEQPPP